MVRAVFGVIAYLLEQRCASGCSMPLFRKKHLALARTARVKKMGCVALSAGNAAVFGFARLAVSSFLLKVLRSRNSGLVAAMRSGTSFLSGAYICDNLLVPLLCSSEIMRQK